MKQTYRDIFLFNILAIIVMSLSFSSCKTGAIITENAAYDKKLSEAKEMEYYFYLVEGNKFKTLGYFKDAIDAYSKCLEVYPNSGVVNYELANIYVYNKDFNQANIYSKKAYDFNPENIWYGLLYANIQNGIGEKKEAINIYEKLRKVNPENTDVILELADFYARDKKNYTKAIELFEVLETKFGMTEELFFEKERIYKKYNVKGKIIPEVKKLVDANPGNTRYLGLYAERLMNEGRDDESYQVYLELLELDPYNPTTHISFGEFNLKKDKIEKAVSEFKISIGNPQLSSDVKVKLVLNLSNYYNDKLSSSQIEDLVDLLIKTHPSIPDGHALKAEILLKKGDLEGAGKELVKVLEQEKKNYLIWEQLISINSELGNNEEMYNHSKEAISYFPNYPKFLLFNGFACSKTNRIKEGLKVLDIGADMVIDQPDLKAQFYTTMAEIYYHEGDFDKSFKYFDKAIVIQPTNPGTLNNYSYYLAIANIQLEKARKMAKLATEITPGNSTYLDTYAWTLYKSGMYEDAHDVIKIANKQNSSNNPVIIEHYGDILYKIGKKEEALKKWQEAAEAGNGTEYLEEKIKTKELKE